MIRYLIIISLLTVCGNKAQDISTHSASQPVEVLCYKGVEYITKNDWKTPWTLAVDKNNKPITCR